MVVGDDSWRAMMEQMRWGDCSCLEVRSVWFNLETTLQDRKKEKAQMQESLQARTIMVVAIEYATLTRRTEPL
jgi:hypothetical protein